MSGLRGSIVMTLELVYVLYFLSFSWVQQSDVLESSVKRLLQ